jgi:two-component system response regulator PilR (NtrC family)
VIVNVAAVNTSMWEDAYFGHKRGAFTGAVGDREGYFGEANRGTIFLDEIGELGVVEQAKLLRVVEDGGYRSVGAARDESSDARIISASNRDLVQQVAGGQFRADLLFRLQSLATFLRASPCPGLRRWSSRTPRSRHYAITAGRATCVSFGTR